MKILVAGGAGFIGSHLVDELVKENNKVIVIDNLSSGRIENINPRSTFYNADLKDFEKIKEIFEFEKPEIIFDLSGLINLRKSIENPIQDAKNNILSSINILELAKNNNVKHIIFSSSVAIYGEPKYTPINEEHETKPRSPYGCAKLAIEKYLYFYKKEYNLKYTILRLSNIYGPRQNINEEHGSVISIFLNKMLKNNKPEIYGGTQTRDFLYVKDAVKALILSLKEKKSNIYNVSSGKETDIIEIFSKINKYFKNKFEPIYLPEKKGEIKKNCFSFEKIKNNLDWKPTISLEEGLDRTYCYYLKNLNKITA
ncbi:MAG: NAD-dependent epimerase/dehydratase family protein [Candidatus Pacearchaeota archaeon]